MQYSQAVPSRRPTGRVAAVQETSGRGPGASIATGDKHAMQVLFGRHNVRVFRFLMRFVDDEATAEDLVSEVFIEVWRQAGQFEARSPGFDLAAGDRPPQGAVGAAPALDR